MATRFHCAHNFILWLGFGFVLAAAGVCTGADPPASGPATSSAATRQSDAVDAKADAATKQLMAAHGLFQRGLFHHAAQAYADFLSDHPDHPQRTAALYALAVCEYRQADYDKAVSLLRATLRDASFAQRDEALAVLGHCLWALKRYDESAAAYEELLAKYPGSKHAEAAALNRAQVLYAAGKPEAIDAYRKARAAAPPERQDPARYGLGAALQDAGRQPEAIAELSVVASHAGSLADAARLKLGFAQLAAGAGADARRAFAAVAHDATDANLVTEAKHGLARCDMGEKNFEQARRALAELLDASPPPANAVELALERAECLLSAGQFDEAAGEYDALATKYAGTPQAWDAVYRHAFCLHCLGRYDQSHAACLKMQGARELPVRLADAVQELQAENLLQLGKHAEAAAAFSQLLEAAKAEERKLQLRLRIAQCAYFSGDYTKAIELLKPLADEPRVAADPSLGVASFLLGDALLQQGKAAEAVKPLTAFLGAAPTGDRREARFKLAMALLKSGDTAAARKALSELIAPGGDDSPWVHRGLVAYAQLCKKDGDEHADGPQLAQALLRLGEVQAEQGDYDASAGTYDVFLSKCPSDPEMYKAHFGIGWSLENRHQYEAARKAYQKVIDGHNGQTAARAQFQIGETFVAEGKWDKAVAALLAVEDVYAYPAWSARALLESGRVFEQLKQPEQARKQYQTIVDKYSKAEEAALAKERLGAVKSGI